MKSTNADLDQVTDLVTEVKANELKSVRVFVTQEKEHLVSGQSEFSFRVEAVDGDETALATARFEAP